MIRCLTVRQPFATLIISGPKRVENRPRPVSYRGPLLIHAGLSMDREACAQHAALLPCPLAELPAGKILGCAQLVDCVPLADPRVQADPWASGPWCWLLADPRPLPEPFACRGQLSLWTPPPAYLDLCRARCDHCRHAQPVPRGAAEHLCGRCGKYFALEQE